MFNLFNIISFLSVGFLYISLQILYVLAVVFGMLVINSKNPILSVLFLIVLFLSISINLILLGYNFIGLAYLLVYVGAISILFLFILMLINVRISELTNDTTNNSLLAIIASLLFLVFLFIDSINNFYTVKPNIILINRLPKYSDLTDLLNIFNSSNITIKEKLTYILNSFTDTIIYYVTSFHWDNSLVYLKDITSVGNVIYTVYGIWLIICSIILLLAMIGAITITKKEKD